jgi:hypothetical protein
MPIRWDKHLQGPAPMMKQAKRILGDPGNGELLHIFTSNFHKIRAVETFIFPKQLLYIARSQGSFRLFTPQLRSKGMPIAKAKSDELPYR